MENTQSTLKPILTGSHAYGIPNAKSDIDLVVYVNEDDLVKLMNQADNIDAISSGYTDENAKSLRFGNLNLLCVTDEKHYEIWRKGTRELKQKAPVPRNFAIQFMAQLREKWDLYERLL